MSLQKSVKTKREDAQLTQEELAKRAHVSRQTIALIETAKRKEISAKTARALSKAFGCSVDELLEFKAKKS